MREMICENEIGTEASGTVDPQEVLNELARQRAAKRSALDKEFKAFRQRFRRGEISAESLESELLRFKRTEADLSEYLVVVASRTQQRTRIDNDGAARIKIAEIDARNRDREARIQALRDELAPLIHTDLAERQRLENMTVGVLEAKRELIASADPAMTSELDRVRHDLERNGRQHSDLANKLRDVQKMLDDRKGLSEYQQSCVRLARDVADLKAQQKELVGKRAALDARYREIELEMLDPECC